MAAAAALVLSGCGDLSSDEVTKTARAFAAPDADPSTRCALLAANTRAALVDSAGTPCEQAIADLPLGTGVRVVPNHVCSAVNLADEYLLTSSNGTLTTLAVDARGRNR